MESVEKDEEYSQYYFLIAVAALLIYMILAAVFESLLNPFIIMFTIPLAAIGSLWAIIFTESKMTLRLTRSILKIIPIRARSRSPRKRQF